MSWQLVGAYLLLGLLLVSLNLRSRWSWWIKLGAIVLTSTAYYFTYHFVDDLKGWPVPDPLPERFSVHWVLVDEPNKITGEEGRIYIWLRHLDELNQPYGKPRVHEVLFENALAQRTEDVLASLMDGRQINGFVQMSEDGAEADALSGQDNQGSLSSEDASLVIEFREVEKVALPPKPAYQG